MKQQAFTMDAFPFSAAEWAPVSKAALAIVNATFAEDSVLQASHFEELCCVLSELQSKYGRHPALLETEADFTDDPNERVALYEEATQLALNGGLLTYTIRISLARVLIEEIEDPKRALQELQASRAEVAACADEDERKQWQELLETVQKLTSIE